MFVSRPRRRNPDTPARIRLVGFDRPRAISPAVEAFLRDVFDASYPLPFQNDFRTQRVLSGIDAVVEVLPEGGGIRLESVRALSRRKGEGTKALRFLTGLADKHGVSMYLYARPFGDDTLPLDALVRFYRRHGFRADEDADEEEDEYEGVEMHRWPREVWPQEAQRTNPARHVYHLTYASDLSSIRRQGLVPRADTSEAWGNEPGVYFVSKFGYEAGAPESEEPAWLRFPAPAGLPPRFFSGLHEAHGDTPVPPDAIEVWADTRGRPVSSSDKGRWTPLVEATQRRQNPSARKAQGVPKPPRTFRDLGAWTDWARTQGVTLRLARDGYGPVEVTDLYADVTGTGAGSRVMTALTQVADSQGMALRLTPSGRRNITFYERFGFSVGRGAHDTTMHRAPRRRNPISKDSYVTFLPDEVLGFMAAYRERDFDGIFERMGAKVDLSVGMGAGDLARGVSLDEIRVTKKRAGVGTRAMSMLTDLADEFGLPMFLYANPLEGNISTYDLAAFYRGFGFEESDEGRSDEDEDEDTGIVMVRYPEPRANPRRRGLDVRPGIEGTYRTRYTAKGGGKRAYPARGGAAWDRTLVRVADETTVAGGRIYDAVKRAERAGRATVRGKRGDVEVARVTNPSPGTVVLEGVESDAPKAIVYVDGKMVGHAQLTRVRGFNDPNNPPVECMDEIYALRQRVGPATLWVMWRSGIEKEHRNKGYGVAMYETLLRGMHAQHNKPAIIFPEECMEDGKTSNAAMRVWASLVRRWESEGRAVASIPRAPNPRR